ncbi:MAG: carbamoyl-phosphate-synthetase [Vulcanimicrobiaceae bacterium]
MRVLLSEASSLSAREHLSVLGRTGAEVHTLSSVSLPLSQFSRWCTRVIRVPSVAQDPLGYLKAVADVLGSGAYDALLPTHEQAWLFAAGRHLLPSTLPLAVAPIEAFDRVQSKVAFCGLLDELGMPQPAWSVVTSVADVKMFGFPCWMKAAFSTAGRGVRYVDGASSAQEAFSELSASKEAVLVQRPAVGAYAQVAGLFSHGRLVAVHTSEQVGVGAGGSAAARIGVDHPAVREQIAHLGAHLGWHGGLTLDYLHVRGAPQYIECNPRTVEPGNAAASGVDLPRLTVAVTRDEPLPAAVVVGQPGRRTHSAMALMLGAAERTASRGPALRVLITSLARRGRFRDSSEVLTPLHADPPSAIPLTVTALQVLIRPSRAAAIVSAAVRGYSVPPSAIAQVRATRKPP